MYDRTNKIESTFVRFGELLGYEFRTDGTPVGRRMHIEGVAYNERTLAPLYANEASVGTNRDLLLTFNILLRMF